MFGDQQAVCFSAPGYGLWLLLECGGARKAETDGTHADAKNTIESRSDMSTHLISTVAVQTGLMVLGRADFTMVPFD
jgi:hypothetical protein